ncbi:DMT family transporter [Thermosipho ferrireducens]|uniref:DMT family transporter n=1 Tax=Thermosipho ferrireducens TaxID=2571116 RepID=A0ABX7S7V1_9BACT|nr:DMT family transporter [Thermosipho ferrireducens]QTA38668.1 DMT family transporter [Thermosipho ferrireducens]
MARYLGLIIVILLWGLSFIATRIVVGSISPLTAALVRFLVALVTLLVVPRKRKIQLFNIHKILAGFWGITAYFAAENIALKFTSPTNAAMIVSTAPIWYVMFTHFVYKKKTNIFHYLGSFIALIGVFVVILNGRIYLKVNPIGDALAFLAAFSWVFYTHHIVKLKDSSSIAAIFEITFWGVVTLIPFSLFEVAISPAIVVNFKGIVGLLYLGVLCSALGYVLWNKSIETLGDRTTTNAVYIIPVVTAVSEVIIFKRLPTLLLILGTFLVVIGLYLFEKHEERSETYGKE